MVQQFFTEYFNPSLSAASYSDFFVEETRFRTIEEGPCQVILKIHSIALKGCLQEKKSLYIPTFFYPGIIAA